MKRLLLISYYYPPFEFVGALRAAGFARYLPEFGWETKVVTATEQTEDALQYGEERTSPETVVDFVPPDGYTGITSLLPLRDPGVQWLSPLKAYLTTELRRRCYDAVMITGGPFLHFEVTGWIKGRHPGLPVVLDFRDPFAKNPRRAHGRWLRDLIAKHLERRWLKKADLALVVTEQMCAFLPRGGCPIAVVENGYDDAVLNDVRRGHADKANVATEVIFAGKMLAQDDPFPVLQAIKELREGGMSIKLIHVGTADQALRTQLMDFEPEVYLPLGQKPYSEALSVIDKGDVGLVLSAGSSYRATTKIYDYIGLGKPIIIYNAPSEGALIMIARRYGRYAAVKAANQLAGKIRSLVEQDSKSRECSGLKEHWPVEKFGRRYWTSELATALNKIGN